MGMDDHSIINAIPDKRSKNKTVDDLSKDNRKTDDLSSIVAAYYDSDPEREWQRVERHRTEYAVTLRALEEHLPKPPAHVLDCGGGPGRYAIELVRRGYQVTLFDLSLENLKVAHQHAEQAGVGLEAILHGSVVDLSYFENSSFDALLLMGPLYHLLEWKKPRYGGI